MNQLTNAMLDYNIKHLKELRNKLVDVHPSNELTAQDINDLLFALRQFEGVCYREYRNRKPALQTIYVKADDFRDHAMGVYTLDQYTDVVLEMTYGYSDLYLRNHQTGEVVECLFSEEPSKKSINEYCESIYGIRFE